MKRIFCLIIIAFFVLNCFSQQNQNEKLIITPELEAESLTYKKEIENLNTLINEKQMEIERNKMNIDLLSSAIDYQNKILDSSGHWITLMAVFLTILAVILPFLTYLFGIKPSQDLLKKNKQLVEKLLVKREKDEVKECIAALDSQNITEKNRAAILINSYLNYKFTQKQINQMIKIAESENDNENIKQTINNILSINQSEQTEAYFINLMEKAQTSDFYYIIRFFLLKGINKYITEISKACEKDPQNLFNILVYLKSMSNTSVIELLNNEQIVQSCKEKLLAIKPVIDNVTSTVANIQESLFYKTINKIEEEQKKREEAEEKQRQQEKEQEKTLSYEEMAKMTGYKWVNNNVIDKKGKIVEQVSFVYTFIGGLQKLQTGVEFEEKIIPIEYIKKLS